MGQGRGTRRVPGGRQGWPRCSQVIPTALRDWYKRGWGFFCCLFFHFFSLCSALSAVELQCPRMPVCKAQTHAQSKESSLGAAGGKGPIMATPVPLSAFCLLWAFHLLWGSSPWLCSPRKIPQPWDC